MLLHARRASPAFAAPLATRTRTNFRRPGAHAAPRRAAATMDARSDAPPKEASAPRAALLRALHRFSAGGIIPALHPARHKGQAGQVVVVGGNDTYTGAPYFAASAALRAGADLGAVIARGAATPALKACLPDCVVWDVPPAAARVGPNDEGEDEDERAAVDATAPLLARAAALVVGPGLGRDPVAATLLRACLAALPERAALVLDADALWHVATDARARALLTARAVARGARAPPVLTPNAAELRRLAAALGVPPSGAGVAAALGGVCVLQKGATDSVVHGADENHADASPLRVDWRAARCRCGGLGDVVAGVVGTYAAWAHAAGPDAARDAVAAAAVVAREAGARAFDELGRGMTACDALPHVARVARELESGALVRDGVRADDEWLAMLNINE